MYDTNDLETIDAKNATKFVYNIMAVKLLPEVSSTMVTVSKQTTANILVTIPAKMAVKSSTPISGKFQIECVDSDGFSQTTYEINYNAWEETIKKAIDDSCFMFTNKVQITALDEGEFIYKETAIGLQLLFTGYNGKPGKFKILSGNVTALTGDKIEFTNTVTTNKSDNIFYPAIPFELLRTVETKP